MGKIQSSVKKTGTTRGKSKSRAELDADKKIFQSFPQQSQRIAFYSKVYSPTRGFAHPRSSIEEYFRLLKAHLREILATVPTDPSGRPVTITLSFLRSFDQKARDRNGAQTQRGATGPDEWAADDSDTWSTGSRDDD